MAAAPAAAQGEPAPFAAARAMRWKRSVTDVKKPRRKPGLSFGSRSLERWPAPEAARDQAHHCKDQEYEEQDLRDSRRARRDASEAEDRCDQRDDEEDDRVVEHD